MKAEDKKTVFVGVSGGVDSSVSLALLKDAGYNVVGVFIKTWQPDWVECTWREEKLDAMRVCVHLDVPFLFFDFEEEYKKGVADYMINEYKLGRTPNPDVMCNREIKFGAFYDKAMSMGADYVATGHYAISRDGKMYAGFDKNKDQSYFLWTIKKEQLNNIIFPVGNLEKSDVRKLAKKYDLPTATKKDSQGICFIGEVNMKEFLSHFINEKEGKVLNTDGEVIGVHKGSVFYTIGERHGFTITKKGDSDSAMYVVSKDLEANTITVAPHSKEKKKANKIKKLRLNLTSINLIGDTTNKNISARNRYRQDLFTGSLFMENNKNYFETSFIDETVAKGQSLVFYDGDLCLGGGIIDSIDFVY
jgi:tRNA-specific 2-thiouridylase